LNKGDEKGAKTVLAGMGVKDIDQSITEIKASVTQTETSGFWSGKYTFTSLALRLPFSLPLHGISLS